MFFSTSKLSRAFGKAADQAFEKIGLSSSHAFILYLINENGCIQQKEIGEILHLTPSTISKLLEKLETRKYIEKQSQGKNVYIKETSLGLSLQKQILLSWKDLHIGYEENLSDDEIEQFIRTSQKLIKHMEKTK